MKDVTLVGFQKFFFTLVSLLGQKWKAKKSPGLDILQCLPPAAVAFKALLFVNPFHI